MTYNVFGGTLSLTQSISLKSHAAFAFLRLANNPSINTPLMSLSQLHIVTRSFEEQHKCKYDG